MVQKIDVQFTCDLPTHRRTLDATEDVETVSFSLNGSAYEIDLCPQHSRDLQEKLGFFERHSRKVRLGKVAGKRTARQRARNSEIREWAREHGYELADRGRIAVDVLSEYDAAH